MDRHVRQRFATAILTVLVIFSINIFSPVGNGDGLGITTIQVRKKTHQLPNLPDQQIAILVGPDINPNWVREQNIVDSLIYSIMKPGDTAPAGISEDCNYLVTGNRDKGISLFFKVDRKKVTIKYVNHGEKLHIKTVPLFQLVE